MGSLFHHYDLNHDEMARKIVGHKRHGGLEAPRNSLELPVETCTNYFAAENDMLDDSEMNCYRTTAPMKKLINEEISTKGKSKGNGPSIVARLMGVDMPSLDPKPGALWSERKKAKPGTESMKGKKTRSQSLCDVPFSSRQISFDSHRVYDESDPDDWNGSMKSKKPMRREHPQEEELQKFKKEFEAWQSARLKECSKVVERGMTPIQWMAQEHRSKEKITVYANSGTKSQVNHVSKCYDMLASSHERGSSQIDEYSELLPSSDKDSIPLRSKLSNEEYFASSEPTRIVILRPGFDGICNNAEPWASSSGASEERDSIEDFLEEVKERLKCEMQGKPFKSGGMVRGGGIETPYSEKPSDPKQIAQRIAKQVRDSVTRDLGTKLRRSESTRSYKGEFQCYGTSSPEFVSRDTRKLLSGRLRNVLKAQSHPEISTPVVGTSKPSMLTFNRRKTKSGDINDLTTENDIYSRSFRFGPDDDAMLCKESSPRNLIRSLSAPVSGTSFGKLLLEDRHIVTGAHIRRKHEAVEKLSVKVRKQRKEKFNIREKVSSFKYSFILKGRLFGRKIHSAAELHNNERDFVKDLMSGPTVMLNLADRPENCTEVPPSPASVCSSVHEDFWRAAHCPSPTTSVDPLSEDNDVPQVFREISSDLDKLRKQLNQLETGRSEETVIEEQQLESHLIELEDQEEAYIRDLLIASGLYNKSSDKCLSRWDPFAKPISNRDFDQVEELYRKRLSGDNGLTKDDKKIDHKMLLDILNETLSAVLGPPLHMSKFRRKVVGAMVPPPHGKTLLDIVWSIIRLYIYPPENSFVSCDNMVTRDLQSAAWSGLVNDDVETLGKEMECQIFGDLMQEIVKDMMS